MTIQEAIKKALETGSPIRPIEMPKRVIGGDTVWLKVVNYEDYKGKRYSYFLAIPDEKDWFITPYDVLDDWEVKP